MKRNRFIREYIKGNGIEIGALHNPIIVPEGATVRYVDRLNVEDLRNQYPELEKKNLVNVDIIDDGEQLDLVDDGSQDFEGQSNDSILKFPITCPTVFALNSI